MDDAQPRPATAADVGAITALVREAYAVYVPRMGQEPKPMGADYAQAVRDNQFWVLEESGALAAVLELMPQSDHLLLANIAVAGAHQGKGFGRNLLAFAEDEARRQGLFEMRLYTADAMHENIALYTRIGYTEMERKTVEGIARVYMSKRISP